MIIPVNKKPYCLHYEKSYPFKLFDTYSDEKAISDRMVELNSLKAQEGYFFFFDKRTKVTPVGWAVSEDNDVLEASVLYYWENCDSLESLRIPSYEICNNINRIESGKKFDIAYSFNLRYASNNYWHFYNDLIGQLIKLREWIDKNITILIPDYLRNSKAFDFFRRTDFGKTLNFYFQGNEIVECDKLILIRNSINTKLNWEFIDTNANSILELEKTPMNIFVGRSHSTRRHIKNIDEVKKVLTKNGFKYVEFDDESIEKQISYFKNAKNIIGIHGASLANLAFCRSECKMLEVHTDIDFPPHYYWLSKQKGIYYNAIIGFGKDTNQNFFVDVNKLESKIKAMLEV